MEEELRCRTAALAPAASPAADARLSPAPQLDAFALLGEYAQRVKAGTMTVAEFDAHKLRVLAAGPSCLPASPVLSVAPVPSSSLAPSPLALGAAVPPLPVSPSLSVVPPPSSQAPSLSQASAPSPAASGLSAPSPLLFSGVPPVLASSEGASAPSLSQRPVRQATVIAAASLVVSSSVSSAVCVLMCLVTSRSLCPRAGSGSSVLALRS